MGVLAVTGTLCRTIRAICLFGGASDLLIQNRT